MLKDEEFLTPWSHFIGMGYDENNPALPPVPVSITNSNPGKHFTPHHHHHHQHAHNVTSAAYAHHHGLSIHTPTIMLNNTLINNAPPTASVPASINASFHSDISSLLNNTGIPRYLQYEGRIRNMFLSKWETETCVNEVWQAREEYKGKQVQMEETHGLAHDFDPNIVPDVSFAEFYWEFIEVT